MEKLVIIDGNSLLFRAYFAMRPMVTSDGVHTQGIYAFINMLNKIIKDNEPEYLAVCFDMKEKTFRHEMYPEYKAGRLKTPIELLSEIPLLHDVLDAMNIKVLEMPRFEADDLIGTVTARASREGVESLVITGDKDELQLIDENTKVLINKKGMSEFTIYDVDEMMNRYELTPLQFIDLKGLMGDKSDNIPGISGVGEKKGIALLKEYGTLEGIIEHAEEIKGKLGENVRASIEVAKLSKMLATINRDAPIEFTWEELRLTEPDYSKLVDIYTKLEFRSLIKALEKKSDHSIASDTKTDEIDLNEYQLVDIQDFIEKTPSGSEVIIDCVCDNSHVSDAVIDSISILNKIEKIYSIKRLTEMEASIVLENLASMDYSFGGYDLKRFVYSALSGYDVAFSVRDDVTVAEYLINPNASKYLLTKMLHNYHGIYIQEEKLASFDGNLTTEVLDEDVLKRLVYIDMVRTAQSKKLEELGLVDLYRKIEMPLIETISSMENEGIYLRSDILVDIGNRIDEQLTKLTADIYAVAGREFNINSPKQLGTVLFEELALPYPKAKGKTYSTAQDVLDKLKDDHTIVSNVLLFRKLSKLKSTYVEGLLGLKGDDNLIHPHFMQTVAATGRLSCTEPNLQNIPIRDDYGREIRKAFVTKSENHTFVGSDYSQIELRIMAALSGDESMINSFANGEDIHRATASRVFNIPMDDVTPLDRSRAKAVNFGIIYGMSGFGLSENLSVSRKEAEKYIDDYFAKHEAVKNFLDNQIEVGEKNREVRTLYGRIRQIPEFASRKYMDRELAKRLAMNTPIQGTAADIIKIAMNNVYQRLRDEGLKSRLILQIHDELIVEAVDDELDIVRTIVKECMESAAHLAVKLVCDINSAKTWYDLK